MSLASQGAMDLQYLSSRYQKGKDTVREWMDNNHRYAVVQNLSDCHADLLKWQTELNCQGAFLALHQLRLFGVEFSFVAVCSTDRQLKPQSISVWHNARLTLLIMDVTVWPGRSLDNSIVLDGFCDLK